MMMDIVGQPPRLDSPQHTKKPKLVKLSDVKPEKVSWLWPRRFALGKLSLLAGDPGLGKSFLTLDMAARVSTGRPWPDGPDWENPAGGVVLLSAEDDIADTIRPRLDSAGADVGRIAVFAAVELPGHGGQPIEKAFDLEKDLAMLDEAVGQTNGCRLVIIDPVTAYLGATDSHKNSDIRALLAPLGQLASRYRVAIIAVTHLNKSTAVPAVYRSMGSLAFAAAARAAWLVAKDKTEPERRLLLPMKNNLGNDLTGLAYRIEPHGPGGSPVVVWEERPVTVSADEALSCMPVQGKERMEGAVEWLQEALGAGKVPSKELLAQGRENGYGNHALTQALKRLKGHKGREGFGEKGAWYWSLPEPEASADDAPLNA